jgi:hypothetical protein
MNAIKTLWLFGLSIVVSTLLTACGGGSTEIDKYEDVGEYGTTVIVDENVPNPEGNVFKARIVIPSDPNTGEIASGPFGLVIFLPGFNSPSSMNNAYLDHLASHGTIAVGMGYPASANLEGDHPLHARRVGYAIDHLLSGVVETAGIIDTSKIATAGHSLGGKIAFFAASIDSRINVVMALDPSNSGGAPCFIAPVACLSNPVAPRPETGDTGVLDSVNAASLILRLPPDSSTNPGLQNNSINFFYGLDGEGLHAVKAPALYFDMTGAHVSFAPALGSDNPRIAKRTMAAWLDHHWWGENNMTYFTGSIVTSEPNVLGFDTRGLE